MPDHYRRPVRHVRSPGREVSRWGRYACCGRVVSFLVVFAAGHNASTLSGLTDGVNANNDAAGCCSSVSSSEGDASLIAAGRSSALSSAQGMEPSRSGAEPSDERRVEGQMGGLTTSLALLEDRSAG